MLGTVKQRGPIVSRIGDTDGRFGSVETSVRHFKVSNRDRWAARLLRGDVGNNLRYVSEHRPLFLVSGVKWDAWLGGSPYIQP